MRFRFEKEAASKKTPRAAGLGPASHKKTTSKAGNACIDLGMYGKTPGEKTKYSARPSPSFSAASCPGQTMNGNDGRPYDSVADKNGTYHWKLQKS